MCAEYLGERFACDALVSWCAGLFSAAGVEQEPARQAADILVRTDARGFRTHGLTRAKTYFEQLKRGDVNAQPSLSETFSGAFGTIEAHNALGQVAGPFAVEHAIRRTADAPLAAYMLRNSGHLGALGVLLLKAAEAGRVALMFQATPPVIANPGASGPMLGNNPLAIAASRVDAPPLVVDMSCAVAARGNIVNAAREGRPIPEGWALDADGQPTTDAQRALLGTLLPAGGHKGMMMSMIVEILAGSLSGTPFIAELNQGGKVRVASGHLNALLLVINPDLMTSRSAYDAHMSAWAAHYKRNGEPGARIPGERAAEAEATARRDGVPLAQSIVVELQQLGAPLGLPFPSAV